MYLSIFYALTTAIFWGAGDFSGGLASRKSNPFSVILLGDFIGAIALIGVAWLFGEAIPSSSVLLWGALAGVAGLIGLASLYMALATSKMGIASPISAVVSVLLPIIWGIHSEGWPAWSKVAGFLLALLSIWFVSYSESGEVGLGDLGLPVLAGVGFGLFFVLIEQISDVAVFWPLAVARAVVIPLLIGLTQVRGLPTLPSLASWPLAALVGLLDSTANAFYALATRTGRLDVTSVLASLYPAMTVFLAWLLLKERLNQRQSIGVAGILLAIVLIVV